MDDKLCAYCKIVSSLLRTRTILDIEGEFFFFTYNVYCANLSIIILCYRKYMYLSIRDFYRSRKLNVAHAQGLDPVLSATRRNHVTLICADPSRGLSFSSALGNCILNAPVFSPVIPVCYPHLRCSCSRLSRIGS